MTDNPVFHLFDVYGVELEYMLVHRESLDVMPAADTVMGIHGGDESEVRVGDLCWSNELVSHVLEFKTCNPVPTLRGLSERFQHSVAEAAQRLAPLQGRLMPTAMHPWMDPRTQTVLWPHGNRDIYEAFDRVFGCKGHGWSNLQSAHLNLPFHGDDEFGRLHAAIRLLLPILPALAASSPIMEGKVTGTLDNRLDVYRTNCHRLPSITGRVIPEPVFTRDQYVEHILKPMYADIAPYDPDATLQEEWLNARGAIARFERNTIEIRVLDVQECPRADLAILTLTIETLKALCEERWSSFHAQTQWPVERLEAIFLSTMTHGDTAVIDNRDYLAMFGRHGDVPCQAGELWRFMYHNLDGCAAIDAATSESLQRILSHGPLAARILRRLEQGESLHSLYNRLCDCLERGNMLCAER